MNIDPILRQRIREGRKTEHRIPVRKGTISPIKPCRYQEGRAYWLDNLQVQITSVRRQTLADITTQDARREGFHNLQDFRYDWIIRHEKPWLKRTEWQSWVTALAEHGAELEDLPVVPDDQVQARFAAISHREVWVLTFAIDFPLYLTPAARPRGTELGYTENPLKRMPHEPEWVTLSPLHAQEARERWAKEQRRRQAERARMTVAERLDRAIEEARAKGLDTSHHEQSILKRVASLENKTRRAA